jgi:hypothetical protein
MGIYAMILTVKQFLVITCALLEHPRAQKPKRLRAQVPKSPKAQEPKSHDIDCKIIFRFYLCIT